MTKQYRLLKDLSDHRAGETLTLLGEYFMISITLMARQYSRIKE